MKNPSATLALFLVESTTPSLFWDQCFEVLMLRIRPSASPIISKTLEFTWYKSELSWKWEKKKRLQHFWQGSRGAVKQSPMGRLSNGMKSYSTTETTLTSSQVMDSSRRLMDCTRKYEMPHRQPHWLKRASKSVGFPQQVFLLYNWPPK